MSRSNATAEFNTFVRGIITEANPLTYPENASLDEENFVLSRDGSRQRRLGMDYEDGYVFESTILSNSDFQSSDAYVGFYRWDNVAGDSSISLGVVHIGDRLAFFDLFAESPSASLKNGGSKVVLPTPGNKPTQFATIGGKLLIATSYSNLLLISYDPDADDITSRPISPLVRDIWGVEDGLGVEEEPATLSSNHRYNLYNQGWYRDKVNATHAIGEQPVDYYASKWGPAKYPSNAMVWYYGKNSEDLFDTTLFTNGTYGDTPAAKGHYIIDPFARSLLRYTQSLIAVDTDTTYGSYSTLASFAGRMFYSGVRVSGVDGSETTRPNLETYILFTQTILNDGDFTKCYQEGDPTSEDSNQIVATDGGTITIPEANVIYKLVSVGRELLVFAENGIWSISGSEEGFSATNFQVSKISNVGAINAEAIIVAESDVYFWSKAGIYVLTRDKVTGGFVPQNITETTIQSLYTSIPSVGKAHATGSYDEVSRKVSWLYNDNASYDGVSNTFRYNKEIILDLVLGSFMVNSIPETSTGPFVAAYVTTPNFNTEDRVDDVVAGADDVLAGTDDVSVIETVRSRGLSVTKYLTVREGTTNIEHTFSEYRDPDFLDWFTEDSVGTDAAAFLETGYFTGGGTQRNKSAKYLTTHFNRTEMGYELDVNNNIALTTPSSCLLQARWDFSDHANSGRWGTQFQAYRLGRYYIPESVSDPFDYGFSVVTTKNKIRGQGKALRLRFDTEAGKDMHLLGWGLNISQADDV